MFYKSLLTLLSTLSVLGAAETRDPWLWPARQYSIWNMPLGSEAVYKPAGLWYYTMWADPEDFVDMRKYSAGSLNMRTVYGTTNSCGTDMDCGKALVPDGWRKSYTMNGCVTFLRPDGRYNDQYQPTTRCSDNGAIHGWPRFNDDLYGDCIAGSHWGSGMSAIGGTIRKGELSSSEPIHHALKVAVYCRQYAYYPRGYVWPGMTCDNGAWSGGYGGKIPELTMGSLLAIHPSETAQGAGITSAAGKKIFQALQDYGAYIVDDTYQNGFWISDEYGVNGTSTYDKAEIKKIMEKLHIVTNNAPHAIGGGGTPRRSLAPPLAGGLPGDKPKIFEQPSNLQVIAGMPAVFNAGAIGPAVTKFQWKKNGAAVVGETNEFLRISKTTANDNDAVFTCEISNSNGTVTTERARLIVVSGRGIPFVKGTPVLDGTVDAIWGQQEKYSVNKLVAGAFHVPNDLSATFSGLWDQNNLYVLAEVVDDVPKRHFSNDGWHFLNDAVQIAIDGGNERAESYDANDRCFLFQWAGTIYENHKVASSGLTCSQKRTTNGYVMEIAIPWSRISGSATVGRDIGFDVLVNDVDIHNREAVISWWANGDDAWYRPRSVGRITLSDGTVSNVVDLHQKQKSLAESGDLMVIGKQLVFAGRAKRGNLNIRDLQGKLIATRSVSRGAMSVLLSGIPSGSYFIEIINNDGRSFSKTLKFIL